MTPSALIAELAQRLGKSEEEVRRFLQTLWEVLPPSPELQPYFFRYLDERFLRLEDRYTTLRQEMHQQIEALRKEMQQGDEALRQQIEALRKEMEQSDKALREEIQRVEEALRKEIQQVDATLRQQLEALRQQVERVERQIERLEKWLLGLTVPVLLGVIGIFGLLLQLVVSR